MKIVKLVPVSCLKCKAPITDTLPGAVVRCYRCGEWVTVESENELKAG